MAEQPRSRWLWGLVQIGLMGMGGCGWWPPQGKDYCPVLAQVTITMASRTETLLTLDGEPPDTWPALDGVAIAFNQSVEQLKQLTPDQPSLVAYQGQLSQIYQDYGQATQMMMTARKNRDRDLATTAHNLVLQAGAQEAKLIPEMTAYCQTPRADRQN